MSDGLNVKQTTKEYGVSIAHIYRHPDIFERFKVGNRTILFRSRINENILKQKAK